MKKLVGIPTFRQVTVPGGSRWKCAKCRKLLKAGEKATKGGHIVICGACIQEGRGTVK